MTKTGDALNYYLIATVFILSFTKGLLAIVGISETLSQLAIEGLIVILFFRALLMIIERNGEIRGPMVMLFFLLLVSIFLSFLLTDVSKIQFILFVRTFLVYYLFFYALFNIELTPWQKEQLRELIIALFIFQIIAAFVKLLLIGTTENFIGSMSVSEGSIATIMPLFAIVYLLSYYIVHKRVQTLLWVVLFIGIGLASNKMGILFYVIILYFYLIYVHSNFDARFFKNLFIALIYIVILFCAFVSLNPRANPERKVGGSVDIAYLINYAQEYQTLNTRLSQGIEGDGRFDAPAVVLKRLRQSGTSTLLMGFGPGELIKSSFTPYKNPLRDKYHIGYGGRLGFLWSLMQIGVVGTTLFLLFHLLLYQKIKRLYKRERTNHEYKILLSSFMGLCIIFFIDVLTYSPSLILNPALVLVYLYSFFYLYTYHEEATT